MHHTQILFSCMMITSQNQSPIRSKLRKVTQPKHYHPLTNQRFIHIHTHPSTSKKSAETTKFHEQFTCIFHLLETNIIYQPCNFWRKCNSINSPSSPILYLSLEYPQFCCRFLHWQSQLCMYSVYHSVQQNWASFCTPHSMMNCSQEQCQLLSGTT